MRILVIGIATLSVLALAVLPPEHLHVAADHDGHHAEVVHRHYTAHRSATDPLTINDHDADPVWLDAVFMVATTISAPIPQLHAMPINSRPLVEASSKYLDPIHPIPPLLDDPPLSSFGLRAPPPSC